MVDEKRIWRKLRSELGLDGERLQGFSEVADRYYQDYVTVRNRAMEFKSSRLGILKRHFGNMSIESISALTVDRFISARKRAGVANSTINRDLAVLSHMFLWAVKHGWLEDNPMSGMEKLSEIQWVGERPDDVVISTIFSYLPAQVVPVYTFLRETGCRSGEAASLTWDKVDYARAIVTFHTTTKSGKSRQVPLTTAAIAALSAMPKHGKTVFFHPTTLKPWDKYSIGSPWERARKKANSKLRIHDLRHAYAIKLAEEGCPMHFISEVLGHANTEFTRKRYARFSPESASRAVLRVLEGGKKYAAAV
jgi:integrase